MPIPDTQRPSVFASPHAEALQAALQADLDGFSRASGALPSGLAVACSGGLDSVALLHCAAPIAARNRLPLRVLHVHHGLQAAADDFAACAHAHADVLRLPFLRLDVQVDRRHRDGLEAAARAARYAALAQALRPGERLWLAQHQDDQAETVLIQLLRGAGPQGLAGMRPQFTLGAGSAARPWLQQTRAGLEAYVRGHGLHWENDPSNADPRFLRNFLRLSILPQLTARIPGVRANLARSAGWLAASLPESADDRPPSVLELRALSRETALQRLRSWLQTQGQRPPNSRRAEEFLRQIRSSDSPALCLRYEAVELRIVRGELCLFTPPFPDASPPVAMPFVKGNVELPHALGRMSLITNQPVDGAGILVPVPPPGAPVSLRWSRRQPAINRPGRAPLHWQDWCRAAGVAPFLRPWLPSLYYGEQLIARWPVGLSVPLTSDAAQVGCRWTGEGRLFAALAATTAAQAMA